MRKQYHFWPGASGLDAWDVDRLVALSSDLEVEELEVESIDEIDSAYWYDESDVPTVRSVVDHVRLIEQVDFSHPIILGPDLERRKARSVGGRRIREGTARVDDHRGQGHLGQPITVEGHLGDARPQAFGASQLGELM